MSRSTRTQRILHRVRALPGVNGMAVRSAARLAAECNRAALALEKHGIRAGEIPIQLPNGRELVLWSNGRDALASRLWWQGWDGYEPESVRPWFWLAAQARTVLDVGANIGLFALLAGLANPDARCWAFEPQPDTRAVLETNIRLNPVAQVTSVGVAVGAVAGVAAFYWDPTSPNDPLASLEPEHPLGRATTEQRMVPRVTLDEWVPSQDVRTVDLVKIDVEHGEPEVLAGMQHIVKEHRPDIIVEILDARTSDAVTAVAADFGYRHHLLTPVGPIGTDDIARHPSCLNHLLTTRLDRELAQLWE